MDVGWKWVNGVGGVGGMGVGGVDIQICLEGSTVRCYWRRHGKWSRAWGGGVPYESSSYSRGCTAEETTAGEGAWSVQLFLNSF